MTHEPDAPMSTAVVATAVDFILIVHIPVVPNRGGGRRGGAHPGGAIAGLTAVMYWA